MEIIKKYKNMSLPIKASFWFMICSFLQNAIATITTPIFTRIMSTEEYGEFSVFISVLSILSVFVTYEINSIIATKGLSKYKGKENVFLSNILFVSSCCTVAFFLIYLCSSPIWVNALGISKGLLCIMFANMFFMPAYEVWSATRRYYYEYKSIVIFTFLYVLISTGVSLCAVFYSDNKGYAKILSFCLVNIAMYSVLFISIFKKCSHFIDKNIIKFTLLFNAPIIFQGLSNQILARSDIFMIDKILNKSSAAVYSLGYSIGMMATILTTSINNTFVPWLYQNLETKNYENVKKQTNRIILGVMLCITCALFVIPEIVTIFAPVEYKQAVYVVAPVLVGIAFTMVYTLFVNVEIFFEKTLLVMMGSIFVAILNIILNFIFIPRYGFIAAAYTTLVSYVLYSIMHYWCLKILCSKEINVNELYNIRFVIIVSISQIAVLFGIIQLYDYIVIRYVILAIIVIFTFLFLLKCFKGKNNIGNK